MSKPEAAEIIRKHIGPHAIGHSRAQLEGTALHIWTYGDYMGYYDLKADKWHAE